MKQYRRFSWSNLILWNMTRAIVCNIYVVLEVYEVCHYVCCFFQTLQHVCICCKLQIIHPIHNSCRKLCYQRSSWQMSEHTKRTWWHSGRRTSPLVYRFKKVFSYASLRLKYWSRVTRTVITFRNYWTYEGFIWNFRFLFLNWIPELTEVQKYSNHLQIIVITNIITNIFIKCESQFGGLLRFHL